MNTSRRCLRAPALVLLAFVLVALTPLTAWADKSYSLDATSIWATVHTDGSVEVIEERLVDLDGHFHGFYWEIDTGASELGDVSVDVLEMGEADTQGNLMPYTQASSGDAEGTWTLETKRSYVRADVHYDKYSERPIFYVRYTIDGVAARWQDTGELYWKFVGDRWDRDSANVDCYVFFEGAPSGTQVVAGENLRGWMHNASQAGTIEVPSGIVSSWDEIGAGDPGTLVMTLPKVREGEFAEVRAAFPVEWLSGAKERPSQRLNTILSEEAGWAEKANKRLKNAGTFATIKEWIYSIFAVLNVIVAALTTLRYRRSHKAAFDDKYFRDVPTNDHPAVLHYVDKGSCGDGPDFTASLMRLSDMDVIELEKTITLRKRLGRKPKEEEDWLLTRNAMRAQALTDPIDKETLTFTFDYVGARAAGIDSLNERTDDTVRMSDFKRVAAKDEEVYEKHLEEWKDVVEGRYKERGYDEDASGELPSTSSC